MEGLRDALKPLVKGDVSDDAETLTKYSRDTSIFERRPQVVVFPKSVEDVSAVVKFAAEARARGEKVSITPRSAGTDMTGGALTDSISLAFTKYMNHVLDLSAGTATTEPGVYYRDFEKETLAKSGMLLPSYPASRELCAMGGIVNNNSGGELTLRYGKTNQYIEELEVVLSDGSVIKTHPLSQAELADKFRQQTLEGDIYRRVHALIESNAALIDAAKPSVTKNSAGYALWNVEDKRKGTFDLSQLICGAQGTLGIVTKEKLRLVATKQHRAMLVVFLSDISILPEIVQRVLQWGPESFES